MATFGWGQSGRHHQVDAIGPAEDELGKLARVTGGDQQATGGAQQLRDPRRAALDPLHLVIGYPSAQQRVIGCAHVVADVQAADHPGEQPRLRMVKVTVSRHGTSGDLAQRMLIAGAVIFVLAMLFRAPTALLMLAAIVGPSTLGLVGLVVLVLVIAAIRERRHGRRL